jgi:uncharacterized protein (TIGR01777 family)
MPCASRNKRQRKREVVMRVLVTGGTGLIGRRIVRCLLTRGDEVVLLTRRAASAVDRVDTGCEIVEGDPMKPGPWMDALDACDAVVNLVGENIFARRWNARFMTLLRDSRILSTRHVAEALLRRPLRADGQPRVLVNASAIGYYGDRGDEELTEKSPPGSDFLAQLCIDWENAARAVEAGGVRCALVRVGVVLDRAGGALPKMLTPFKLFAGGPVGSGRQWLSWVHHEDMTNLFLLALDHTEARGPLNGTAPQPVLNRAFAQALGRVLHRPSFVKTPAFALRLMLGKAAQLITEGQRVLPRRPLDLGFAFKYPTVDEALRQILAG